MANKKDKGLQAIEALVSSKKEAKYDPKRQTEGIKKRIKAAGLNPEEDADKRSALEKLLNLPEGQNTLFDILEIINRPQQALFGGISASQEGKDFWEGARQGISGEKDTMFRDILNKAKITQDSKDAFGLDDVLGFAGDVFLDPVDLAILPASIVGKGAKVANTVANAGQTLGATAKAKKMVSPLEVAFAGAKKGGQKAFRKLDDITTSIFAKLDQFAEAGQPIKKSMRFDDVRTLSKTYKNLKASITSIFDKAKALPKGLLNEAYRVTGGKNVALRKMAAVRKELFDKIDNVAKAMGKTSDEVGEMLADVMEFQYKPKLSRRDFLLSENGVKRAMNPETHTKLITELKAKFVDKHGVPILSDELLNELATMSVLENGEYVWLFNKGAWNDVSKEINDFIGKQPPNQKEFWETFLDEEFDAPRFYSKQEIKQIQSWMKDPAIKQLYVDSQETLRKMYGFVDEQLGSAFKTTPDNLLHHATTEEAKQAVRYRRALDRQLEPYTELVGNTKAFSKRDYTMSTREANMVAKEQMRQLVEKGQIPEKLKELIGNPDEFKMFEKELQKSIDDFVFASTETAKSSKMLEVVVAENYLKNEEYFRPAPIEGKIPRTVEVIDKNELVGKLNKMKNFAEDPSIFDTAIKEFKNLKAPNGIMVDKNIYSLIAIPERIHEISPWLEVLEKTNNMFKRFSLLSPGFQLRNMMGNTTNLILSGVPLNKFFSYSKEAAVAMSKGPDLMDKVARKGIDALTSNEQSVYKLYEEFVRNGFHEVAEKLYDLEPLKLSKKQMKKYDPRQIMRLNAKANEVMDKQFRMTALIYAKKNPDILAKVGVGEPASFIRKVLFDPNDLSVTEQNVLKKLVPFYTFTKKNLGYHMRNIFDNPVRYNRLKKAFDATWENVMNLDPEKDVDTYKRENFWIPIVSYKDGKYVAIKANLPLADFGEFMDNPLNKILSSITPALRAPFEAATNTQIYTGLPIQEFEGQRGYTLPEIDRKAEYLLSQFGLTTPTAGVMDIGRTISSAAKGEIKNPAQFLESAVGRSLVSTGNSQKTQTTAAYRELNNFRELMKYYKQEGIDIPYMRDIAKSDQEKSMEAILNKLKSIRSK